MLILYDKNAENFDNNGMGVLRDATNAYINRKINSIYELEFEYPKTGFLVEYLQELMIVKADGQLFKIKDINKSFKNLKLIADHIFYDLNNNFLEDVAPTDQTGGGALNWMLNRTQYPHRFTVFSNVDKINSSRYVRKNVVNSILGEDNALVKRWGGEIDPDNFQINYLKRLGADRGLKLIHGKNIQGIDVKINIDELTTRIMPQGAEELLLPEKYIDSPLINNYPTPIIRKIDFSDIKIDDDTTEEQAYTKLEEACNKLYEGGLDKPRINIKIDFIELSKTEEYKKYANLETVYLGDTVSCFVEALNVDVKIRVISTKKNVLKSKYEKLELGDAIENFATKQIDTAKKVEQALQQNTNLLDQAKQEATELITNALGGYVVKTQSEIFIMDTDDVNTAVEVWRWNKNGLGYSSTGVNGDYGIAITSNGKINADYITTGTLSVERITGLLEKLSSIDFGMSSITSTVTDLNNRTVTLEENLEGLTNTMKETGGLNILHDAPGYFGNDYWNGLLATKTNTEILDNTRSDIAFNVQNGTFEQTVNVQNGTYTLSGLYKKLLELANIKVTVNDVDIPLVEMSWKLFIYTFQVTNRSITVKVTGDSSNAGYLADLMLNSGDLPQVWSLNQNETYTDAVKIGKGITIDSTNTDTRLEGGADGIRIRNKTTNDVSTEFTTEGTDTNKLTAQSSLVAGLLTQRINEQVCMNNIGGVM